MRRSFLFAALFALPAFADESDRLDKTLSALQENQVKAEEISKEVSKVNKELDELESQSRSLVVDIRAQQERIASNRAEMRALEDKRTVKQQELNARRDEIGQLLYGMIRLQRMPRHYIAAQPSDMHTLLRTASALDISYEATHRMMDELQAEYAQLGALEAQLKASQQTLSRQLQSVERQQASLTKTLSERRQIQQSLRRDQKRVNERVAKLSAESENLQQLIAKLEAETLLFKNVGLPSRKPAVPQKRTMPIATRKGGLAYPAAGDLVSRFGDKRDNGERIEGIEIATAAGAPVTAPYGGKIVFSGEFMDYGPMIIIEHDKTYHSVIAGLDLVEVQPGDPIETDDIIGVMGANNARRTLYFELRKNSKPIDPGDWMGNVSRIALKR